MAYNLGLLLNITNTRSAKSLAHSEMIEAVNPSIPLRAHVDVHTQTES